MGMMEFAGQTGREVLHDWASAPFVKPPDTPGRCLDAVILGLTTACSENKFSRKVGPKESATVPPFIEVDVLLCEHAKSGAPFRLAVRGFGLVPGLCRHVDVIDWPRGLETPGERQPPDFFDEPTLISIRCIGKRKADVGEYTAYSVGEIMAADPRKFIWEYREKHAGAADDADAGEVDNEIPF